MKPYAAGRRLRFLPALAVVALGWLGLSPQARAEGSAQVGTNQWLHDYNFTHDKVTNTTRPIYVNILEAGEVINVSLCGSSDADNLRIEVHPPVGAPVTYNIASDATNATGKVACNSAMSATLTSAYKHTATTAGTYEVRLFNLAVDAHGNTDSHFKRFDVTVTPSTATNPNPTAAGGRVWARVWAFTGSKLYTDPGGTTNADYFVRVPGGRASTEYIWKLDLNKFAGYLYDISANSLGVDSPNSGYSVPRAGNSVTPLYPVYLSYPAGTIMPTPAAANVSGFRFVDSDGQDSSISPGDTAGVQDSGFFRFTTDVSGTYAITVDTNRDGNYGGSGDRLLLGPTTPGENSAAWDGKNAAGAVVGDATYNARLQVRLGEYHFVAQDVETSGGGSNNGLTIYRATSALGTSDTQVFWDDTKIPTGTTTLPGGLPSSSARHTWGNFTETGFGDEKLIDTYVYGAATAEIGQAIVSSGNTPIVSLAKTAKTFVGATAAVRSATGAEALPDDVIEYTLVATNTLSYSLTRLRVRDALPVNTVFVSVSATADFAGTVLYSSNGTTWATSLPSLAAGGTLYVAVDTNGDNTITAADAVPPGKKITVTLRVRVR